MLKIREYDDNGNKIDLKELEKYGFKYEDNDYRKEKIDLDYIIDGDDKEIFIASTYGEFDKLDDTLYDLIKDDLVEKVKE